MPVDNNGRRSRADRMETNQIALDAIVRKYGSIEKGMLGLLHSENPQLMLFVFQHAFGKVPDKVITANITQPIELVVSDPKLIDDIFPNNYILESANDKTYIQDAEVISTISKDITSNEQQD